MPSILAGLVSKLPILGLISGVLLPLLLWDCSRSRLEDLRLEYSALEAEYAALAQNLADCRAAAGLHDAVLAAREREIEQINNKYSKLREEFLRSVTPAENDHAQTSSDEALRLWCAQPLPHGLARMFSGPGPASALPGAPGYAAHANQPASRTQP